jgi:DNA-binding GntR family transcriptional regulator
MLSQHVADSVRRVILSGRFKPGERLVEHELASELNVSRAPVRDALRLLAKEGLVTLIPHRGAIVTTISAHMVIDAFSVRAVLEGMAARLAISRLTAVDIARLDAVIREMELTGKIGDAARLVEQDIEFHRLLTATCQRPVLLEALAAISNKTYLLIAATRYAYPLDRLAELHAWIVQAVRSGDPDRLEAAVRDHIAYGQHVLLSSLGGSSETSATSIAALPPAVDRRFLDPQTHDELLPIHHQTGRR